MKNEMVKRIMMVISLLNIEKMINNKYGMSVDILSKKAIQKWSLLYTIFDDLALDIFYPMIGFRQFEMKFTKHACDVLDMYTNSVQCQA